MPLLLLLLLLSENEQIAVIPRNLTYNNAIGTTLSKIVNNRGICLDNSLNIKVTSEAGVSNLVIFKRYNSNLIAFIACGNYYRPLALELPPLIEVKDSIYL